MALKPLRLNQKTPENLKKSTDNDDNDDGFTLELEGQDDNSDDHEEMEREQNEEQDEEADGRFQDEAEDEENEQSEDDNETSDEETTETSDEEEEEVTGDDEDERPVSRRENHRIRTLVEEKNRGHAAAAEEKRKRIAVQKQLIEVQKTSVDTTKTLLKNSVAAIKAQLMKAQEDSDVKTIVDLTEQLGETQNKLAQLDSWKPPAIEEEESAESSEDGEKQNTKRPTVAEAPAVTRKWISKNSWFTDPKTEKDKERQLEAAAYSEVLTRQGYTLDDPEMFTLIDKRLERLGLAHSTSNKVQSKSKDKKSASDNGRKTPKKISQTVQGGSRNPNLSPQKDKSKVIRLTKEQQEIADLYGISYEDYALEALKIEESNKSGRRMTQIFKK